jgi:hypothetical protein
MHSSLECCAAQEIFNELATRSFGKVKQFLESHQDNPSGFEALMTTLGIDVHTKEKKKKKKK